MLKSVKIYIVYHNNSLVIRSDVLTPIHAGKSISDVSLDMIADNSGDNISEKNGLYCELTAQYWAWKNDKVSDYIGFMHYRRFFDLYDFERKEKYGIHGIIEPSFYDGFLEEYGLIDSHISEIVTRFDAVIPEPVDVIALGFKSVYQQYSDSPHHFVKDFDTLRSAVKDLYPDDLRYFDLMASGRFLYPTNMFILKRQLFNEYCIWLFSIIEYVEKNIDVSKYNSQERRVIGYLSERLFTLFVLKRMINNPSLNVKEVRRIFVTNTKFLPVPPSMPKTELPIISIATSTDRNYLPHASALIVSILLNARTDNFIDLIILDGGLTSADRKNLVDLERLHPFSQIKFVDMSGEFLGIDVHYYFKRSTFYRLSMSEILYNRDKVLYLDADMIVLGDVADLYNTDLEGKHIAAVRDLIMRSFCAKGVKCLREAGNVPANVYLQDYLKLLEPKDYFQAGTILFDLAEFRKSRIDNKMISALKHKTFWFLDQDVLNMYLSGKVKFLDHSWNTVWMDEDHLEFLVDTDKRLYENSQSAPKIIHYAGIDKPWDSPEVNLGNFYWLYLRQTSWYERVLISAISSKYTMAKTESVGDLRYQTPNRASWSLKKRVLGRVWRNLPKPMRDLLLPTATRISEVMR